MGAGQTTPTRYGGEVVIKAKLKMPKKLLNAKAMSNAINEASDDTLKFAKGKLEGVTGKFDTVDVAWDEVSISGKPADWELSTTNKIYGYLDEGTRVRYAHMTPDFVPRTSPGSFSVGPKTGGVAFINKSRPLPGIKPRKWTELTARETKKAAQQLFKGISSKSLV